MEDHISKVKLLDWIQVELAKEYPSSVAQYVDGRATLLDILKHRIEQGVFVPDSIPAPTLKPGDKKYVCCECKNASPSHSWNISTLKIYGSDIHLIEDDDKAPTTLFICPRCGSRVDFNALEVSHD